MLQQRASENSWHFPTVSPCTLETKAAEDTLCTPVENHHSPTTNKKTWLPQNDVPADGIAYTDITNQDSNTEALDRLAKYALITKEEVWNRWSDFIKRYHIL